MLPSSRETPTPAGLPRLAGEGPVGPMRTGPPGPGLPRRYGRRPAHAMRADESAVSEVVGFILVFGIISSILLLAMLGFASAEADARDRVQALQAEAAADRVAGLIVEAALFAENHGDTASFSYRVHVDERLEGDEFTITVVDGDDVDTQLDAVEVELEDGSAVRAALFQAGTGAGALLCTPPAVIPGGSLLVRYDDHDGVAATSPCIFLEAIP